MDTGMEPIVPDTNRIVVIFGLADGDNSPGHIGGGYIKLLQFSTSCNSAPVNGATTKIGAWHCPACSVPNGASEIHSSVQL